MAAAGIVFTALVLPAGRASADVTFNQRMVELVNQDRAANGLQPLVADANLNADAESAPYNGCGFTVAGRAQDMGQRNYFSHTILGCGAQGVFDILTNTGLVYSGAAENIAWMNATTDPMVAAANLHSQLMASAGHRANILNPNFTTIGVGSWHTNPGQTWSGGGSALPNVYLGVEIFASGMTPTPATISAGFHAVTPSRILDTRSGNGAPTAPVASGATINLQVTGRGGVPSTGVSAVVLNVTVTSPATLGYLTVFPAGETMPMASNLNFAAGQTVPNLVTAKLGANGQVSIYNGGGSAHVIADVAGWYDTGSDASGTRFHTLTPSRILDTRTGNGAPAAAVAPGGSVNLQVTGRGGVPSTGVSAVVVNVVVTAPTGGGFLTVFPAGEAMPVASNLNYSTGQTVANLVSAKLGANGQLAVVNSSGVAATHVLADVAGWFDLGTDATGSRFHPVTPSRILDTRTGNGSPSAPLGQGATLNLQVTGRGGVPASGAVAVVLNVTVTGPTGNGYVTVFPAGEAMPVASNVNFTAGQTVPNLVTAKLGANGQVSIFNAAGATHVIADVAGWYGG